ncbi:hypothetical protein B296_00042659 [Ensete ventricosum]|uniref:Uncharacterized protein n=1 Tax=Ensete ventricosum TaxID=4639 RepID=A0A426YW81_ENSVE|nr:hypothetical protein B296_00042659 [Ensete ventricosum]
MDSSWGSPDELKKTNRGRSKTNSMAKESLLKQSECSWKPPPVLSKRISDQVEYSFLFLVQPGKSLYTTVRELVENALDSAESISQLPDIEMILLRERSRKNLTIRFARRTDVMPPAPLETKHHPSACLSPAGEYNLRLGIIKELQPDMVATCSSRYIPDASRAIMDVLEEMAQNYEPKRQRYDKEDDELLNKVASKEITEMTFGESLSQYVEQVIVLIDLILSSVVIVIGSATDARS